MSPGLRILSIPCALGDHYLVNSLNFILKSICTQIASKWLKFALNFKEAQSGDCRLCILRMGYARKADWRTHIQEENPWPQVKKLMNESVYECIICNIQCTPLRYIYITLIIVLFKLNF